MFVHTYVLLYKKMPRYTHMFCYVRYVYTSSIIWPWIYGRVLIINSTIYGASISSIYSTLQYSCVISATIMADEAGGLSSPTRAYEKMVPERVRLHMAMTALQFCYAGQHIILSAAVDMGVSKLVFPVYRNLTALLLLVPFAYFLERYICMLPLIAHCISYLRKTC